MKEIGKSNTSERLVPRQPDAYKGDFGKLLMIAGSQGMTGAAVLSARGGLRSGAGTVTVATEEELFPILQISVPEAMCVERGDGLNLEEFSSIVLGPGLGFHDNDEPVMRKVLREYSGTLVMDADGLNNIGRYNLKTLVAESGADIILTPHPGEAARLLGREKITNREEVVKELAEKYKGIAVLKGHGTLICDQKGDILRNTTGNPGMATGGSGDVLAGIIGALASQGYSPLDAATIGVYVHGFAGDLCAKKYGEMGMTAGDLIEFLPLAYKKMSEYSGGNDGNQ